MSDEYGNTPWEQCGDWEGMRSFCERQSAVGEYDKNKRYDVPVVSSRMLLILIEKIEELEKEVRNEKDD